MKHKLPSLMLGLGAACFGAWELRAAPDLLPRSDDALPAAQAAVPNPADLVRRSAEWLARRRSIVAKVRHRARLFDREIIGSGEFAQGPVSSRLLRYDLRMQIGDRVVGRLQVSDGTHLWIVNHFKNEPDIERVDVDRVVAATGQGGGPAYAPDPALGGLSHLLAKLRADFDFHSVFRSQLGDVPTYGLEGRWRAEALAKLLPAQAAAAATGASFDLSKLPAHVPDRVVLYLGVDDLFPYRVEYHRDAAAADEVPAETRAMSATARPLLVLEFFEVRFDGPLEETLFLFSPGTRKFLDVTESYLAKRTTIP